MNDTTRDAEIRERERAMANVARFRLSDDQMAEIKAFVEAEAEKYGLMSQQEVRADERKRIREALLSDGAVINAVDAIRTSPTLDRSSYHSLPPEGPGAGNPGKWVGHELRREWREYVGRPALQAALDHIGLGEETTEESER